MTESKDATVDWFNHKLLAILQSPFLSPLEGLKKLNDQLSIDFFSEMQTIVEANLNSKVDYGEKVAFIDVNRVLTGFLNATPI